MTERSTVRIADLCDLIRDSVKPRTRPDALYLGLEHLAPGVSYVSEAVTPRTCEALRQRSNPATYCTENYVHISTKRCSLMTRVFVLLSCLSCVQGLTLTSDSSQPFYTHRVSLSMPLPEQLACNTQEHHGHIFESSGYQHPCLTNSKALPICFGLCMMRSTDPKN